MSARLRLTSQDLYSLAGFLSTLTKATADSGIRLCPHSRADVEIDGATIAINWDEQRHQYVIDGSIGD